MTFREFVYDYAKDEDKIILRINGDFRASGHWYEDCVLHYLNYSIKEFTCKIGKNEHKFDVTLYNKEVNENAEG